MALVGGGPTNLVAAKYLAEAGVKVAIYEQMKFLEAACGLEA